ncbi:hypothetical protein METY_3001 [Methylopila sp. Yamaguchi]|nr:hypothetical protein METY_3001 [Methylopila sp. Yamaguchi]
MQHRCLWQSGLHGRGRLRILVADRDATLAAQNALLAAESLGLGTCYIGALAPLEPRVPRARSRSRLMEERGR